jgi:Cu2+-containing amine oxidase
MSFVPLSKIICFFSTLLVLVFWLSNDVSAQRKPDFTDALNVARVSAPLTSDERALAVKLAEQALKANKLFTDRKMYLTEARFSRDTASEMKGIFERLAVLIYYRYDGDLTIEVFINLTRQKVLAVKQLPNLMPPISGEEFTLAKEMVFTHPKLKDVLGRYRDRLVVEPHTSRSESPKDPLFRHRVIYMLFRTGSTYLIPESRVSVDLTTEKVIIEPAPRRKPM